jgi:hypothetical protein
MIYDGLNIILLQKKRLFQTYYIIACVFVVLQVVNVVQKCFCPLSVVCTMFGNGNITIKENSRHEDGIDFTTVTGDIIIFDSFWSTEVQYEKKLPDDYELDKTV